MQDKTQDKTTFLDSLLAALERRLTPGERRLGMEFAKRFWARVPPEDLTGRDPHDAAAATLTCWRAFERRHHDSVYIAACNPHFEHDGWSSSHTVVILAHPDMSFITDSTLIELTHEERITHHLQNVVFQTSRDEAGRLLGFGESEMSRGEVLIYAEIDRLEPAELEPLQQRLAEILTEVRAAVGDFAAMRSRVERLAEALRTSPPPVPREELDEAIAFLEWLPQNNFTFLGCRDFDFSDGVMRQVPDSALGTMRLRKPASARRLDEQPPATREFLLEPTLLAFSKAGTRSRVHRPAYPDYIGLKHIDSEGRVTGEYGLLGLWTSPVYTERPHRIPIIRRKVANVRARSGFDPQSFDGKVLAHVLDTYPRDELFQSSEDELLETAMGITHIHERRRTSVFIRKDRYGLFYTCLVYMPRDLYNTQVRVAIQNLLIETFGARDAMFSAFFSESILVRVHFTLRVPAGTDIAPDIGRLKQRITELARDWTQELRHALIDERGEIEGNQCAHDYAQAFPAGYREHHSVEAALADIRDLEQLTPASPLRLRLFRDPGEPSDRVHLKVFHLGEALPLSNVLPTLEHMDLTVIGGTPYLIRTASERRYSIQAFDLRYRIGLELHDTAQRFEEAFLRAWRHECDDDSFNRLILGASLTWREVVILRSYARYMKQTRFGFGQDFISDTLIAHPEIARLLVSHFLRRFDPQVAAADETSRQAVLERLEEVSLFNEDRILRRFLELIDATQRTSYFQRTADGAPKGTLALKLAPTRLTAMPQPVPSYEIFVFSARFEGVHLRAGRIARGGLRWSDRLEDYRTEILGLLKAQVVKNAVIVPTGAKGGFVLRRPPADRAAYNEEGITCYRAFIGALLDVTDNIVEGRVLPPADLRRHDGDDPYLVVAADKGTATFSDTANETAAGYRFWLKDAFASGGSHGYDHKGMGITARGAWISVMRHFDERGIDVGRDPISVVGIGDMGGDVFGNGMLRSRSIRLIGAFNHRHIFIDPDPDPQASFTERQRLFGLGSGGWNEYDEALISPGGGIFSRTQKRITVTPEMRERLDTNASELTPDELIRALLRAPVDLIWNGGIGTFVRSSGENDADVGDRDNDALRVTAAQLRATSFAEGGNLGMTQRARIEFNLRGGMVNTDFIDNSGGVDCSDHEVNLKILLNEEIEAGELTMERRNLLLEEMTEEVAGLVLANNARQTRSLSLGERHARTRLSEYQRFIMRMEVERELDRDLEAIAVDEELNERATRGSGLTRPELAVLLCYAKMHLKDGLVETEIDADAHVRELAYYEFPATIRSHFAEGVRRHRLAKEIIATVAANELVDHMGITATARFSEFLGRGLDEIVKAFLVTAECFSLRENYRRVEALAEVSAEVRYEMLLELMQLARRATRWFLRFRPSPFDTGDLIAYYRPRLDVLVPQRSAIVGEAGARRFAERAEARKAAGVPEDIAAATANAAGFASALPVIWEAAHTQSDPRAVATLFAELHTALDFDWLAEQLIQLTPENLWQAIERDALLDELIADHARLAACIHRSAAKPGGSEDHAPSQQPGALVQGWLEHRRAFAQAWQRTLATAHPQPMTELAALSVICRKLGELVESVLAQGA